VSSSQKALVRFNGFLYDLGRMSYHCPTCQRIIYNRRLAQCEFCGADIPASLRFSAAEIATLDRKLAESAERRKQRELEQEEGLETKMQAWPATPAKADVPNRSPSAFGGIAAVMVLGVGSLIVAFNLPPEMHDRAVSMVHAGVFTLAVGVFAMGIILSPTQAGKCLVIAIGAIICSGILAYYAASNEWTGRAVYHEGWGRGARSEPVTRDASPVKFRQATNFLWGVGGLCLGVSIIVFTLYRKVDD
jgi:hypothetical protein